MTDAQMVQIHQQFANINQQLEQRFGEVNQRLDQVDGRLNRIDERLDRIDVQFEQVDNRFDQIDVRFDQIHVRFGQIDNRFEQVTDQIAGLRKDVKDVQEDVAANSVMLQRVDAEVNRRGIELERHTHELKLAIEQFQSLQKVMNTKLDIERKFVDQRLDPLELTVRDHTDQLSKHSRRLERLEHE